MENRLEFLWIKLHRWSGSILLKFNVIDHIVNVQFIQFRCRTKMLVSLIYRYF
ncbi:hypothetical protein [Mucilaginibacter kameinonensis]|uniref:hypothetical protein n=1 Tax=Mucilaginibacter kameinonensis TaxID=452286 RepID=UPI0013CF33E9|nr:hypothetical protein [Mucilaginibacter kameinonensis]